MSNDVSVEFRGDNSDLNHALQESQQMVGDWGKYVKGAIIGLGAAFTIQKIGDFAHSMISAYADAQEAETKLASVVKATGEAAGYSTDQLISMSNALEMQLAVDAELIQGTEAVLATFRNIKGDHFKEATIAAYDMATVLGGDASSAAMQLGKALNDPVKGMTALGRAGVTFTTAQEEAVKKMMATGDVMGAQRVILDELAKEFGGAATDKANTFNGAVERMMIRIGNLGETIGEWLIAPLDALGPVMELAIDSLEVLFDVLGEGETVGQDFGKVWGEYLVDTFKWLVTSAADVFSFFEASFENWSLIVERSVNRNLYSLMVFGNDVKYLFTEVMPQYLQWFAENWANILTDLVNFNKTVFMNMLHNVGEFIEGVWAYLNGEEGGFEFTALTEGFEATMKELPKIAARELNETERNLAQVIKAMDKQLERNFDETYKKNRDIVDRMFKGRPPEKIDMTANMKPFETELEKAKEEVKKVKKDVADSDNVQHKENETVAGEVTALEQLAKDIQSASFKSEQALRKTADDLIIKPKKQDIFKQPDQVDNPDAGLNKHAPMVPKKDEPAKDKNADPITEQQASQEIADYIHNLFPKNRKGFNTNPDNDLWSDEKLGKKPAGVNNFNTNPANDLWSDVDKTLKDAQTSSEMSRRFSESAGTLAPTSVKVEAKVPEMSLSQLTTVLQNIATILTNQHPETLRALEGAGGLV